MPDISRDGNDLAYGHYLPARGLTLSLKYLNRTIQHIKYLWIGVAMEWNLDSGWDGSAHHADLVVDLFGRGEKLKQNAENNECLPLDSPACTRLYFRCNVQLGNLPIRFK